MYSTTTCQYWKYSPLCAIRIRLFCKFEIIIEAIAQTFWCKNTIRLKKIAYALMYSANMLYIRKLRIRLARFAKKNGIAEPDQFYAVPGNKIDAASFPSLKNCMQKV
jgi:hypothetical protein